MFEGRYDLIRCQICNSFLLFRKECVIRKRNSFKDRTSVAL